MKVKRNFAHIFFTRGPPQRLDYSVRGSIVNYRQRNIGSVEIADVILWAACDRCTEGTAHFSEHPCSITQCVHKRDENVDLELLDRIACTDCKDVAYCYRCFVVCVHACLLDITMSCVLKRLNQSRWRLRCMGPTTHVLSGGPDPLRGRGNFGGMSRPIYI